MKRYYAIFDKKLSICNPPFICDHDQEAIKVVRNALVSCPDGDPLPKLADVCDLVYVGSFDDIEGKFVSPEQPRLICHLSDVNTLIGGDESAKIS